MIAQPSQITSLAIEAAKQAALIARAKQLSGMNARQKGTVAADVVTDGDISAQTALEKILPKELDGQQVGLLGEEAIKGGRVVPENAKLRWVVDPIDGTLPYSKGEPFWSVSIALQEKKWADTKSWKTSHAVIYRASAEDTPTELKGKIYWAEEGKGAHVIDLKTGTQRKLEKPKTISMLAEFEKTPESNTPAAALFASSADALISQRGHSTTWHRSICHASMAMLEGELSCVVQGTAGPFDWDIAALSLIVPEAGAHCDIQPREADSAGKPRYSAVMGWDATLHQHLIEAMDATHRQQSASVG